MTGSKRIFSSKVMILSLIIIIFSLCVSLYPRISCNGSGGGYGDPGDGEGLSGNSTIENLVAEGAGYYLQGNSYIQSFLNQVELQDIKGIDYTELQRLIANAVENITNARITYEKLVNKAEATPYNPVVIEKLKSFDYKTFMLENRLNESVFNKVEGFLSDGDITGSYRHVLSVVKNMEFLLNTVKNEMDFNRLELYWELNELCAETTLFGSFIARVFHQIH